MRRVVLAIFALTVLLPSLGEARARWMIDVDLYVRESCCCPPHKVTPIPLTPTLQRVCCKLEKRGGTALPLATSSPATVMPAAPVASFAFLPAAPRVLALTVAITQRAQAPPDSTLLAQFRGLLL